MLTTKVPDSILAIAVDWPTCYCGATPESGQFPPCDQDGRELDPGEAGSLIVCSWCGLILDVASFDEQAQTMRVVGRAESQPPAPAPARRGTPRTRTSQEYLNVGDPTREHVRGLAARLVDAVRPVMPDDGQGQASVVVDAMLRTLLEDVLDNYDPDTGDLVSSRMVGAGELHQLIREVRTAPDVLAEVFVDHEQIEAWAALMLKLATGKQLDREMFTSDRYGLYVGPTRELVQRGERVEAVVLSPDAVWFRRERPETATPWPACDGEFHGVRIAVLDTNEQGTGRVLAFVHDPKWAITATRWLFTQRRGGEPPATVELGERRWVQITPDCQCTTNGNAAGHDDAKCMVRPAPHGQPLSEAWHARVVRPYTPGAHAVTMLEVWDAR